MVFCRDDDALRVLAVVGTGRRIAAALRAQGVPLVVAKQNREGVEALRAQGRAAVSGEAATPSVLIQARVATAAMWVIAIPDDFDMRKVADIARGMNREIEMVLRPHSDETAALMQHCSSAIRRARYPSASSRLRPA